MPTSTCFPNPALRPNPVPPNFVPCNPNTNIDPQLAIHDGDIFDPRWTGAMRVAYGQGSSSPLAYFRAQFDPASNALFLIWHQQVSLGGSSGANSKIFLGLTVGNSYAHVFELQPFTQTSETSLTPVGPVFPCNPSAAQIWAPVADWTFGTGWTSAALAQQSWIRTNTSSWFTPIPQDGTASTDSWALAIRVPLSGVGNTDPNAGLPVSASGTFNLFYWMVDNTTLVLGGTEVPSVFPSDAAYGNGPPEFPAPNTASWAAVTLGGTGCGTGVSIDGSTILISYAAGPPTVNAHDPPPNGPVKPFNQLGDNANLIIIDPTGADNRNVDGNKMFATVHNNGPENAGPINALYRLANWGATVGVFASPNDKNAVWKAVAQATPITVPTNADAKFMPATWGDVPAGTPNPGPMNQFLSSPDAFHQCMMIELSGGINQTPNPIVFINDSAIQNMNFAATSLLESVAEINVRGLGADPFGTANQTIYLLVETRNFPPVFDPANNRLRQLGSALYASRGQTGGGLSSSSSSSSSSLASVVGIQDSAFTLCDNFCPLLKIHAFHETGHIRPTLPNPTSVLAPMTSFGHYLDHVGTLLGWDYTIVGAERIGPFFWRLRVPNDGKARITIRILAKENPGDSIDHSNESPTLSFNNVALFAKSALTLADRVQVQDSQNNFTAPIGAGGSISVGTDAKLGNVVAGGSVTLRDRDQVTGSVTAHQSVSLGNGVRVSGGVTSHATVRLPNLSLQVTFPSTNQGDVTLPPDAAPPAPLAPGAYANVTVFSRATLKLTAGTYYFNSLDLEPQAKVVLDNSKGQVTIYIRTTCILRGQFTRAGGGTPSLFIGVLGQTFVSVEAPFIGTLVVPNGTLNLATVSSPFQGAFFAGNITVQPGAVIKMIPFNGVPAIDA
jgi:hypothetical protein